MQFAIKIEGGMSHEEFLERAVDGVGRGGVEVAQSGQAADPVVTDHLVQSVGSSVSFGRGPRVPRHLDHER
jgi:hypothetical protein